MRVIAFCSADRNLFGALAQNFLDRHRLGAVVELGRARVRVHVIDLLGCDVRVRERVTHGADARIAAWQRRRHMKRIIVQTVTEHFGINFRTACPGVLEFFQN